MSEKIRFVKVVDQNGNEIPRSKRKKKNENIIAVLVVDQDNKVIEATQYDVAKIAKAIAKAQKKGTSEVMIARELANLGDESGEAVRKAIIAALYPKDEPHR